MCTVSLYFALFVLKRGAILAKPMGSTTTTYPRLIAINIVRGCNISPMGGILFPDKTKSGFAKRALTFSMRPIQQVKTPLARLF